MKIYQVYFIVQTMFNYSIMPIFKFMAKNLQIYIILSNQLTIKMQQLQKYRFDSSKPLTKPYDEQGVKNIYYKGFDTFKSREVLISEYSEQRLERLLTIQKRLLKLKEIKHENIVQIYDVIIDKDNKRIFAIMEWCEGGNLYDYQKYNSTLDCDLAVKIIQQLMNGIRQLHKGDEMHRYINMQNVEFSSKGVAKLSYRCLYPKMYYLSPQHLQGNRGKQNDIFAIGVLFYKMLLSQTPFKGNQISEQIAAIQDGANFPKDEQKMFPLSLPNQIKNMIFGMTAARTQDRWTAETVIEQCTKYLKKMNQTTAIEPDLSSKVLQKIFKKKYIPISVRLTSPEEHIVIALQPQKFQFTKFHIFKSRAQAQLSDYVKKVLGPYCNVKDEMEIVPIFQNYIIDEQYLVIRTFYDNQGSLKYYLQRAGTIKPEHAKNFIQKLMGKLKRYGKTHNHLTNQNILIKSGVFYINYPPFMTKQYMTNLKNSKSDVDFIAPQIKEGKTSQNADAWSVAALKYLLENKQMPKFDKNGKIILNSNKPIEERQFYENALVKDSEKRKNLAQLERLPQQRKQRQIDEQLQFQRMLDLQNQAADQQAKKQQEQRRERQRRQEQNRKRQEQQKARRKLQEKRKIEQAARRKNQAMIDSARKKQQIHKDLVSKLPKDKSQKKTLGELISQKFHKFHHLQKHWTKPMRVGIKCVIGLILLIFLYYWNFFLINGQLITEHSLYQPTQIKIRAFTTDSTPQISYNLVTKTPSQTYTLFYNKTLSTLRDEYRCVLNDYSVQSNVVSVINSTGFTTYQVFGILFTILNLIFFCLAISKMDFPKVLFIGKLEENNFNQIWNWMFVNMALATQISFVYLLYGSLFHMELQPCLAKASLTAVEFLLKSWFFSFNIRYIWIYIGLVLSYVVLMFFIIKPQYTLHKALKAVLICLYLAGAFSRIMGGSGGHVAWKKQSVFGKVGELLLLIIGVIYFVLDLVYGCCTKRAEQAENKINRVNNDESNADLNITEESMIPD